MRLLIAFILVVAALAAPAGAHADGALTFNNGELRFGSASQDSENLVISREFGGDCFAIANECLQFANGPQQVTDNAANCSQVNPEFVECSPAGVTSVFLELNDGDDFAKVLGNIGRPTTFDGSFGNDTLDSRDGSDIIRGGPGNDEILDDIDNGGDDTIEGGEGDDTISLDGGNDNVTGGPGGDTVTMGTGDDTVRLDDVANDGPTGAAKNVHSDVETVEGNGGSDNLFGNEAANTLRGDSGNDLIQGGGGGDQVDGGTGADELNGGPDVDTVVYSDSAGQTITLDDARNDGAAGELDNVHSDIENVAAGAGNDVVVGSGAANLLDGGPGDDQLDGQGAVDAFFGGDGADTLLGRDGAAERVECGPQNDGGQADTIDALVDCEGVAASDELVPDADGDGSTKQGGDCNDRNPAIRPGAVDVPENGIDENCDGVDARIPVLDSRISTTFVFARRPPHFTTFTTLQIGRVHAGSRLRMNCRGRGCPFRTRTRTLTRDRPRLTIEFPLRRAKLRPGARFEVRLTLPGTIGLVRRSTVRRGKAPATTERCLRPGATRPTRCPA
jgi:Ca2+-binding RTX toxin-like protein